MQARCDIIDEYIYHWLRTVRYWIDNVVCGTKMVKRTMILWTWDMKKYCISRLYYISSVVNGHVHSVLSQWYRYLTYPSLEIMNSNTVIFVAWRKSWHTHLHMYLVRNMTYVFINIRMYIYRTSIELKMISKWYFAIKQIRITSNEGRNMFDVFKKYIKCVVFHILNQ